MPNVKQPEPLAKKATSGVTLKKGKESKYEKDLAELKELIYELNKTPLFEEHLGHTVQSVSHLSGCINLQDVTSIDAIIELAQPTNETLPIGIQYKLLTTISIDNGKTYNHDILNKLLILFKLIKKHRSKFMEISLVKSSSLKGGKTKKSRKSKNKTRRRKNKQ
jgi:hypothetical protein